MTETETEKTPLQQKLDEFGQQLSKVSRPAGRPFRLSFVPLKLIHTATPDTTRLSRLPVDRRRRDAGQA